MGACRRVARLGPLGISGDDTGAPGTSTGFIVTVTPCTGTTDMSDTADQFASTSAPCTGASTIA